MKRHADRPGFKTSSFLFPFTVSVPFLSNDGMACLLTAETAASIIKALKGKGCSSVQAIFVHEIWCIKDVPLVYIQILECYTEFKVLCRWQKQVVFVFLFLSFPED